MWTVNILQKVSRTTCLREICATYTAAGHVRKSHEALDSVHYKVEGFAQKREMLHGCKS
jgi:tRNA U34 5-methylaminomethyl-2-thiouridine-forming methyltransferase MnmC